MGAWSYPVLRLHEAGVTLSDLAEHTGLSHTMLKLYCRGAHKPRVSFYEAIAELGDEQTARAIREYLETAA